MSTRAATALSWGFVLGAMAAFGVVVAEFVQQDRRGEVGALMAVGVFLVALTLFETGRSAARRWGQRRIREGGLRDYSAGRSRRGRPAHRIDALGELREEVGALRGEVGGLKAAYEVSHPDAAPAPGGKRQLYAVRDEADATKPLPRIA